jgi:hypothetical protein
VAALAEKSAAAVGLDGNLNLAQAAAGAARPQPKALQPLAMRPREPENPDGVWEEGGAGGRSAPEGDLSAELAALAAAAAADDARTRAASVGIQALVIKASHGTGPPGATSPPGSELRRRFAAWKARPGSAWPMQAVPWQLYVRRTFCHA